MANKISVILDVATDKAVGGLKGFKQAINDADGATGKMRAGAKITFDEIKKHAATAALAAGAALVAFGAKGVAAFTDLALEAGKFRDTTGATLDEASRWIAVGDDIGLSGDQISGAFNKMNVAIGSGKPLLKEYGIELQHTADGQMDANATFLHAIDVINGIKDPTKKAELAAATFGRGWTEMSELIEQGSGTITAAMAEVSDAQIIDDSEVAKAKAYRESMDKLGDSVKDLAMEVGEELTPAVTVAADALSDLAPAVGAMARFVGDQFTKIADEAYAMGQAIAAGVDALPFVNLAEPVAETLYEISQLERGTADLVARFAEGAPTMEQFAAKLKAAGIDGTELSLAIIAYREQLDGANTVTGEAVGATDDLSESLEYGTLAAEEHATATDNAKLATDAKKEADEAAAEAAEEHAEAMEDLAETLVDNASAAMGWVAEVGSAMDTAAGSISEFSEEALADIDTFQQELSDNVAALAGWQTNLSTIASETSSEFATYLAEMGLEGAGLVEELAGNTPELETTFEQWKFASAVAGRDMVAEFAKVNPKTQAEFEALGRDIGTTLVGVGELTAEEAEAVGRAIAAGMASGVDFNAYLVAAAAVNAVRNAHGATTRFIKAESPSKLFADTIGKPIVWGIVEGINDEEQKLIDAAQQAAEKLVEGFEKEIESSAKDAIDAVDDMVDEVADRFDDMWDVVEGRRDIEGLTEGVADAEADLAEANQKVADSIGEFGRGSEQHLEALEGVSDATEKLENANYRLLKASQALLDQGPAGQAAFVALGQAAGLEAGEIGNLISAYHELIAARAEATAQTDAINAEAAEAQSIRARFGQAAAQGLAKDWIDHIAQFAHDPAFQLELMRQFLATVSGFASGGTVPGPVGRPQLAVVHGGEHIMPANTAGWAGSSGRSDRLVESLTAVVNNYREDMGIETIGRALTLARLSR